MTVLRAAAVAGAALGGYVGLMRATVARATLGPIPTSHAAGPAGCGKIDILGHFARTPRQITHAPSLAPKPGRGGDAGHSAGPAHAPENDKSPKTKLRISVVRFAGFSRIAASSVAR